MQQLEYELDREIHEMDTVLLRLTTLRLLMAAGQHQLVDLAVSELDHSMRAFQQVEGEVMGSLADAGYRTLAEAAAGQPDQGGGTQARMEILRSRHSELRVALASTGAAAERSVRMAADDLAGMVQVEAPANNRHPFLTPPFGA